MGYLGNVGSESPGAAQALAARVSCEIETTMLWTILVVLFVLWLLGMVTSHTLGGFIHILLLVALAIFVINLIQGQRRTV
jgi:Family of unknown function (DUF5670)